jgi:hypothetical protein
MGGLRVAPKIEVTEHSLHGCTPWLPRLLWLFSYCRCVKVDRQRERVVVTTRQLWWWERVRTIAFDQVSHIVYRAQALPSLSLWRYFTDSDASTSAFFLISLALKSDSSELPLFMVWEEQPSAPGWLDRLADGLAGTRENPYRVGDESSRAIVETLREFLSVPISSH